LKKIHFSVFLLLLFSFCTIFVYAQDENAITLMSEFIKYYSAGNLSEAEAKLRQVLGSEEKMSDEFKVSVYNNLGAICTALGKYNEALIYYNKAEELESLKGEATQILGDIFINKAIIFGKRKSYNQAFEYYKKSISIYDKLSNTEKDLKNSLASAYLNYGSLCIEVNNLKQALELLYKSA